MYVRKVGNGRHKAADVFVGGTIAAPPDKIIRAGAQAPVDPP